MNFYVRNAAIMLVIAAGSSISAMEKTSSQKCRTQKISKAQYQQKIDEGPYRNPESTPMNDPLTMVIAQTTLLPHVLVQMILEYFYYLSQKTIEVRRLHAGKFISSKDTFEIEEAWQRIPLLHEQPRYITGDEIEKSIISTTQLPPNSFTLITTDYGTGSDDDEERTTKTLVTEQLIVQPSSVYNVASIDTQYLFELSIKKEFIPCVQQLIRYLKKTQKKQAHCIVQ